MSGSIEQNKVSEIFELVGRPSCRRSDPLPRRTFDNKSIEIMMSCQQEGHKEWRSKDKLDMFRHLYETGQLSDMILEVGTAKKEVIHVHKLILAVYSDLFKNWFQNLVLEPGTSLKIKDVNVEDFHRLLRFIYTEEFEAEDIEICMRAVHISERFQVKEYTVICLQYIEENITVENIFTVYDFALKGCHTKIHTLAKEAFVDKCHVIFETSQFLKCQPELLNAIVKDCAEHIDALILFMGLLLWSSHRVVKVPDSSVRKVFSPFLPFVRFLDMSLDDFTQYVAKSEVLSTQDISAITSYLGGKTDMFLPTWCMSGSRTRVVELQTVSLPSFTRKTSESKKVQLACRIKVIKEDLLIKGVSANVRKQIDRKTVNLDKAKVSFVTATAGERQCIPKIENATNRVHFMFPSPYQLNRGEECLILVSLNQSDEDKCKYFYEEGLYLEKSVVAETVTPFIIVRCLAPKMEAFGLISKVFLCKR